jgi:hypothetical protein
MLNTARNLYPQLYQRFPETYLQSATLGGADRVRLSRLVWDNLHLRLRRPPGAV